jgi:hypothetical protein
VVASTRVQTPRSLEITPLTAAPCGVWTHVDATTRAALLAQVQENDCSNSPGGRGPGPPHPRTGASKKSHLLFFYHIITCFNSFQFAIVVDFSSFNCQSQDRIDGPPIHDLPPVHLERQQYYVLQGRHQLALQEPRRVLPHLRRRTVPSGAVSRWQGEDVQRPRGAWKSAHASPCGPCGPMRENTKCMHTLTWPQEVKVSHEKMTKDVAYLDGKSWESFWATSR